MADEEPEAGGAEGSAYWRLHGVGRVTRQDVLQFRFRQHQLDRPPGTTTDSGRVALLDFGVQDTGPDGAG